MVWVGSIYEWVYSLQFCFLLKVITFWKKSKLTRKTPTTLWFAELLRDFLQTEKQSLLFASMETNL